MNAHHTPTTRAGARHKSRLVVVFGLMTAFMVVEGVAGVLTGSLALLSDAGHMAADSLGLGMALAAIVAADKATGGGQRTFGLYRLEILAALANALLLFVVAGYVLFEALRRVGSPPEVLTGPMLAVAVVGLIVNVVSIRMLHSGAQASLNIEGAFLEVIADLMGSVGVVIAAVVMIFTGWPYADVIIGAGIGIFILPRAYRLGRKALRILVQAAPEDIDVEDVRRRLAEVDGVTGVHDLHVWTLTSEMPVASVHLIAHPDTQRDGVLERARHLLESEFAISHATLQVEGEAGGCSKMIW